MSNTNPLKTGVNQGRIQDFKLGGGGGGGARKKIAPSGGRRENCWAISCEKSRFYANKSYFSNGGGRRENFWGISCEKSRFYAKKSYFFPISGGGGARRGRPPPWIRPCICFANFRGVHAPHAPSKSATVNSGAPDG